MSREADAPTGDMIWIRVDEASTCAAVRRRAADLARHEGLSEHRVDEVSIAATELASNLVKHARDGSVLLRRLHQGSHGGLGLLTVDGGPGASDIGRFTEDGLTTTGTLGIGLGAVRRFADRLDLHSVPGVGTVVSAEFWTHATERGARGAPDTFAALTRPIDGESVCGDAYAHREVEGGNVVMLADGLGHGPLAARASTTAVRTFLASTETSPGRLLEELHQALRPTRGAAVAVAHLDDVGLLRYAGVGNISGRVADATSSTQLSSQPGIVGSNAPRVREQALHVERGQSLVMHSDGLTDRWRPEDLPGFLSVPVVVTAAALLRTAGVRRDDAAIVVLRAPEAPL